jgi:hypothetical protein
VPGPLEGAELEDGVDHDPEGDAGSDRAEGEERDEQEVTHGYGCDLYVLP